MTTPTGDAAITVLLTSAWVTATLGLATEDLPLLYASVPSVGLSLVLHVIGARRRTPTPEHVRRIAEARTSEEVSKDIATTLAERTSRTERR